MIFPDNYINKVINGDCLEVMKGIPDNTIDLVLTDPPYGYSFMGKDWDKAVPSVDIWKECLRVLKPGGFCFVMSAPRQDVLSRMMVNLEDSGFRTDFTSIYWTYANGFPKAGNISKLVDRRLGAEREVIGKKKTASGINNNDPEHYTIGGTKAVHVDITTPASEEAKALDGSYTGYQPKPAVEVIIVCMKPLNQKTFVDQAMDNGKGVTWLDDCRVPYKADDKPKAGNRTATFGNQETQSGGDGSGGFDADGQGRFPANLLVSDNILNDKTSYEANNGKIINIDNDYDSRYFSLDEWDKEARNKYPFLIVPKASKSEKNKGCEDLEKKMNPPAGMAGSIKNGTKNATQPRTNHHPTVKPLKLMRYLITLATRENDIVLDPFNGSGTTCVAGLQLNRKYIGIDLTPEYVEIARKRISAEQNQRQQRLL